MKTSALFAALALALVGCGTLLSSNPQTVSITSDPSGAKVTVNGEARGTTPTELSLPTTASYQITVQADGYDGATRVVTSSLSVGYIALDILFGVVPLAVDYWTDSLHHLDPGDLHFQFAEVAAPPPAAPAFTAPAITAPAVTMPSRRLNRANARDKRGSDPGSESQARCCINGAYYDCPDLAAVAACAPPELAGCMMGCGMDMSCPEACLDKHRPDPSQCERNRSKDGSC